MLFDKHVGGACVALVTTLISACGVGHTRVALSAKSTDVDDAVSPPPEYFEALHLEKTTQGQGFSRQTQVLWLNFNGAWVERGYNRGQSFILCKGAAWVPAAGTAAPAARATAPASDHTSNIPLTIRFTISSLR